MTTTRTLSPADSDTLKFLDLLRSTRSGIAVQRRRASGASAGVIVAGPHADRTRSKDIMRQGAESEKTGESSVYLGFGSFRGARCSEMISPWRYQRVGARSFRSYDDGMA